MLAYNQTVFEAIKYIHIVCAIVWVGSGLYFQFQGTRLARTREPARMVEFSRDVEFAGTHLLIPASGLLLLAGITMVAYSPVYNFTDTWILLALTGYALTFLTGSLVLGPTAGKIGPAVESEGPGSATAQALIRRVFLVSRVDQVVLLLVVADMVFKPGS